MSGNRSTALKVITSEISGQNKTPIFSPLYILVLKFLTTVGNLWSPLPSVLLKMASLLQAWLRQLVRLRWGLCGTRLLYQQLVSQILELDHFFGNFCRLSLCLKVTCPSDTISLQRLSTEKTNSSFEIQNAHYLTARIRRSLLVSVLLKMRLPGR